MAAHADRIRTVPLAFASQVLSTSSVECLSISSDLTIHIPFASPSSFLPRPPV